MLGTSMLALLLLLHQSGTDLNPHLIVGDSWTASVTETMSPYDKRDPVMIDRYFDECTVKVAEKDRWVIETKQKLVESTIGGTTVPAAKGLEDMRFATTFKTGALPTRDPETTDSSELRLWRLKNFIAPPQGDSRTWKIDFPQIGSVKAPPAKETWSFAGDAHALATPGTAELVFEFQEADGNKPIKATGYFSLDRRYGIPLVIDVKAQNVQAPGGDGSLFTCGYSMKVKELHLKDRPKL